jgi:hypothetical protein
VFGKTIIVKETMAVAKMQSQQPQQQQQTADIICPQASEKCRSRKEKPGRPLSKTEWEKRMEEESSDQNKNARGFIKLQAAVRGFLKRIPKDLSPSPVRFITKNGVADRVSDITMLDFRDSIISNNSVISIDEENRSEFFVSPHFQQTPLNTSSIAEEEPSLTGAGGSIKVEKGMLLPGPPPPCCKRQMSVETDDAATLMDRPVLPPVRRDSESIFADHSESIFAERSITKNSVAATRVSDLTMVDFRDSLISTVDAENSSKFIGSPHFQQAPLNTSSIVEEEPSLTGRSIKVEKGILLPGPLTPCCDRQISVETDDAVAHVDRPVLPPVRRESESIFAERSITKNSVVTRVSDITSSLTSYGDFNNNTGDRPWSVERMPDPLMDFRRQTTLDTEDMAITADLPVKPPTRRESESLYGGGGGGGGDAPSNDVSSMTSSTGDCVDRSQRRFLSSSRLASPKKSDSAMGVPERRVSRPSTDGVGILPAELVLS